MPIFYPFVDSVVEDLRVHGESTVRDICRRLKLKASQVRKALQLGKGIVELHSDGAASVYSHVTHTRIIRSRKRKRSIASATREMICAGMPNGEILEALVKEFGVDPAKKLYYPSWCRAKLVRDGVISKAFAERYRR